MSRAGFSAREPEVAERVREESSGKEGSPVGLVQLHAKRLGSSIESPNESW